MVKLLWSLLAIVMVAGGVAIALYTGFLTNLLPAKPMLRAVEFVQTKPIVVLHVVDGSKHTFSGEVMLGGCTVLGSGVSATGTSTTLLTINLRTFEPVKPCDYPDAPPAPQLFETSFVSKEKITLQSVTINEKEAVYRVEE